MSDGAFWRGALLDELERAVARRTLLEDADSTPASNRATYQLADVLLTQLINRAKTALAFDDAAAGARLLPELQAATGE